MKFFIPFSYDRQLTAMQEFVEKASQLIESRVKREIAERVQSAMEHSISKRANTKGVSVNHFCLFSSSS